MTAQEVGTKLVELCQQGKNMEALETLYANDIVSVEAFESPEHPDMPRTMEGIAKVKEKNQWWYDNHEVHGGDVKGPFPHGEDRFAALFSFEITPKNTGERMKMEEVALYTVKNNKIVKEEFFYPC